MSVTQTTSDRTRLAPEDAFINRSPSHARSLASGAPGHHNPASTKRSRDRRKRSRSRRRKTTWKKLLWVKHPGYPDNYTDEETFLDALQRNPRLRPYEFWPLMSDSTVIVQQVCTMIVFVCCFSGIYQKKVSPMTIVSWGTIGAVLGWILWDVWVGREEASSSTGDQTEAEALHKDDDNNTRLSRTSSFASKDASSINFGLGLSSPTMYSNNATLKGHPSQASLHTSYNKSVEPALTTPDPFLAPVQPGSTSTLYHPPFGVPESSFSRRNQQRLATLKSAILIYCALLGLSPILKSLTKSTASDSIWAISFWLMCINVTFFDYGSGVGATFPASLSTNAALMASTVLASRLESTTHVFSLTLFSIEVFGLFPVFRRYLRHISWRGHLALTWVLVVGAGGGVALVSSKDGGWATAMIGVVLGCALSGLAMGLCSWWLIGLQRFKNEIYGPWDPARPIIRRWD